MPNAAAAASLTNDAARAPSRLHGHCLGASSTTHATAGAAERHAHGPRDTGLPARPALQEGPGRGGPPVRRRRRRHAAAAAGDFEARCGLPAVPQVYLDDERVGGADDTLAALADGWLLERDIPRVEPKRVEKTEEAVIFIEAPAGGPLNAPVEDAVEAIEGDVAARGSSGRRSSSSAWRVTLGGMRPLPQDVAPVPELCGHRAPAAGH